MDIFQLLQELDKMSTDFDITINASNLLDIDINKLARIAGEKLWEFYVYYSQTEDKKLIRIRK